MGGSSYFNERHRLVTLAFCGQLWGGETYSRASKLSQQPRHHGEESKRESLSIPCPTPHPPGTHTPHFSPPSSQNV